jgi:hypothetical protein
MAPVPSGTYLHLDPLDGSVRAAERFSCAPGPAGWRYVATVTAADGRIQGRIDLTVDARWRPVRLELRSGGWLVRGGALGPGVVWVRSGESEAAEYSAATPGFAGSSPAFLLATARMLRLPSGESRNVELTSFTDGALAAVTVRQNWSFRGETQHSADLGTLPVAYIRISDLDTGEEIDLHIAGDIVIAADGIELDSLDGPPNSLSSAQ